MSRMRPVLAAQLCLAVFQAFLLAPAQHVHDSEDADHEHSTVIHSHFSPHTAFTVIAGQPAFTESEEHEAWPLDTFTIVLPIGLHPVLLSRAPDVLLTLRVMTGAVATVEERAHDPPGRERSIPRAPPA
jgi:hypothetical protein